MNSTLSPQGACCIVGGGPAGMMLGYLLARAGVEVLVLEKHADFLRDFRGDTVHPSTLEILHELGALEEFLKRPHQRQTHVSARIEGDEIVLGDMSLTRTHCRFLLMMPQWEFLDFLAGQARQYPTFHLRMATEVTGLLKENGRVVGIRGLSPAGPIEVRSQLVVGADGRNSVLRAQAGLAVDKAGAPMDVLWMRLSRRAEDPELFFYAGGGQAFFLTNRGAYWQCGYPVPKGAAAQIRAAGMEALRASIVALVPFLRDRVGELNDWNDIKLLTVEVDRMPRWHRPGLLCIGDAAHAMSPVGGVGINLAIQDAVAAANILANPLRRGAVSPDHLEEIQRRRVFPTKVTQFVQRMIQSGITGRGLSHAGPSRLPLPMRLLERTTIPRRVRTRIIAVGVRPERVNTPDIRAARVRQPSDHLFLAIMATLSLLVVFLGFARSYYLRPLTQAQLPLLIRAHAAIFTAWMLLFALQTGLAGRGRLKTHRRLGIAGGVLAVAMVIVGVQVAISAARSGYLGMPGQETRDPRTFLIVPLRDIVFFGVFAALGFYFRRTPPLHKRLMLLAVIAGLLPAATARLPGISHFPPAIGITLLLFLLACPVYDFVRYRRTCVPYLCGALLAFLLIPPVLAPFATASRTWLAFANWLIR